MNFPTRFSDPDPTYSPTEFNLQDNFNVLHISEIHAFEPEHRKEEYKEHIGQQIDAYLEEYDIDRISILGDTGTRQDVEDIFAEIDDDIEAWIVAGDEDKVRPEELEKEWVGWFEAANSPQPFDIENKYRIFDEGYETEIGGNTVQASHHPCSSKREDSISFPDPRYSEDELEPETPEEIFESQNESGIMDELFSVNRDTNENTVSEEFSEHIKGDILLYDHVHMPYPRKVHDTAVVGLGGRSHNYQIKADSVPLRSLHINSHGENLVHTLHFDAENDQIFEHQVFDFGGEETGFYDILLEDEEGSLTNSGYLPIQSRFVPSQFREEASEGADDIPALWGNRN